jgi:glycosyltransferase involved in cell wall biosynthesis
MNILMVLADRDFPPDIRVEKEIRTLIDAGHNITIICSSFSTQTKQNSWKDCPIVRVKKTNGLHTKINTFQRLINFYDRYWAQNISHAIELYDIQVLHIHDLPMLGTAISVSRKYDIPVIADLHENYPAMLKYYMTNNPQKPTLRQRLLYNHTRWESYETRTVMRADHIIVVVEEAKQRIVNSGIPAQKITVIENTVDIDQFNTYRIDRNLAKQYSGKFIISYIGGFGGYHRGLDTAIQAMPEILSKIPNAFLLLVGDGSIKNQLIEMVNALSLHQSVEFITWQPIELVPSYISLSDICIVPHHTTPHTETTSPHKLFQYMLMGKPVVVSSCKPLRRIVVENNCGLVFQAGDKQDFSRKIWTLKDSNLRERLGKAGQKAVFEKYNWHRTSKKLLAVYEQLQ